MEITWVGMTRQHFQPGRPGPVRAIVVHATAGVGPGDLAWLRKGGDERRPVSCHYYINKAGRISQLVRDEDTAWHAGRSRWTVDGRAVDGLNAVSVGIELENRNSGHDPYPEAQVAAAVTLVRALVRRHGVPRGQLVRHVDISPGRKTDPAGLPWPAFVAQVFADEPETDRRAALRERLLDRAYRAAGAALPATWPLREVARRHGLGMPVAAIGGDPVSGGSAQDDRDRPVRLPGQPPLIVEVYAGDLVYAPTVGPNDDPAAPALARRLADTAPGALREALLGLLFGAADPANGYQAGWAFHQRYLEQAGKLGVPIGPSHRLTLGARQLFVCQHFAYDSLCSPVGAWQTIYRLSELEREQPGLDLPSAAELRRTLLDDLYRARLGRRYDPAALLARHAEQRRLGAPLGRPEIVTVGDEAHLLVPYAGDVLACHLPALDWPLDQPLPADAPVIGLADLEGGLLGGARLRPLLRRLRASRAPLFGPPQPHPCLFDLGQAAARRAAPAPEAILIVQAPGPPRADLRDGVGRWHYYLSAAGAAYRLCHEAEPVVAAPGGRAVVIAVEGDPAYATPAQRAALSWLVRALAAAFRLPAAAIRVGPTFTTETASTQSLTSTHYAHSLPAQAPAMIASQNKG